MIVNVCRVVYTLKDHIMIGICGVQSTSADRIMIVVYIV